MRPEILVCVSQQPNEIPFQFKTTGIQVYSFEEVLYHVYHYWKQSVDDLLSDEMIAWVNDALGLSFLSARMKELAATERFSQRIAQFLALIDYFDDAEIKTLLKELDIWEKQLDWEKLKERGDFSLSRGHPEKALVLYRRALQYGENAALLNNAAVAYLQMEAYGDAFRYLGRALALDDRNTRLLLNYAEASIYNEAYDTAQTALQQAAALEPGHRDIPYLRGELAFAQGDYSQSIRCFEEANRFSPPEPHYVFRLADVYVKMRQHDKALETLEQIEQKDVPFLMKQAELYAGANNVPAAVKSIQKALLLDNGNVDIWVRLAMYHRMDYDLAMANAAITKALSLDPEHERAKLESARIKKGMGRTREYQAILNSVLGAFKQKYRELNVN